MENSSVCVINENCAYTENVPENCKFPDSASDYPMFVATTETTKPNKLPYVEKSFHCTEERSVEEYKRKSREKFKFVAIIICCVIWTLATIIITICMLKMVEIV